MLKAIKPLISPVVVVMVNTLDLPNWQRWEGLGCYVMQLGFLLGECWVTPRTESHCRLFFLVEKFTHFKPQCLILWQIACRDTWNAYAASSSGVCPCVQLAWGSLGSILALLSPHVTPVLGPVRLWHLPFLLNFGHWWKLMREHRSCQGLRMPSGVFTSDNILQLGLPLLAQAQVPIWVSEQLALSRGDFLMAKFQPEDTRSPIPGNAPPVGHDDFTNKWGKGVA